MDRGYTSPQGYGEELFPITNNLSALDMKILSRAEEEFERLSKSEDEIMSEVGNHDSGLDFDMTDDEFRVWLNDYDDNLFGCKNTGSKQEEQPINSYANKMRVENLVIASHEWAKLTTNLEIEDKGTGKIWPLKAMVCEITDKRVLGYIPSKTFNVGWNEFMLMFYINETLPDAVRPFKKRMFAMWAQLDYEEALLYDINIRLFMDQVKTDTGFVYFFIFGEDEYDSIIAN